MDPVMHIVLVLCICSSTLRSSVAAYFYINYIIIVLVGLYAEDKLFYFIFSDSSFYNCISFI